MRNISIAEQIRDMFPESTPESKFYNGTKWRAIVGIEKIRKRIDAIKQMRNELETRGVPKKKQYNIIKRIIHNYDMLHKDFDSPECAVREALILNRREQQNELNNALVSTMPKNQQKLATQDPVFIPDPSYDYSEPRVSLVDKQRQFYLNRNQKLLKEAENRLFRKKKSVIPGSGMTRKQIVKNKHRFPKNVVIDPRGYVLHYSDIDKSPRHTYWNTSRVLPREYKKYKMLDGWRNDYHYRDNDEPTPEEVAKERLEKLEEMTMELERKKMQDPENWYIEKNYEDPEYDAMIPDSKPFKFELDDDEVHQFYKVKYKKENKRRKKAFKRVSELTKRIIKLKKLKKKLLENPPKVNPKDPGYYDEYRLRVASVQYHIDQNLRMIKAYTDPITGYDIQFDDLVPDQIEYEKNVAEKKSWWEKTWDTITEWTKKFIDPIVESVADFFERNCAPIKIITSACGFIGGIIWGVFGLK